MADEKIIPSVIEDVVNIATTPTINPRKWTFKKVMLSIVTLYFLIIIIKYLFKFLWKALGILRRYIHDLTDEKKFVEVMIWSFVSMTIGVILGILLREQILLGLDWVKNFWKEIFLPWFLG